METPTGRGHRVADGAWPPLQEVRDDGDGRYEIATVTGGYLLDLCQRRLMRFPRTLTTRHGPATLTFEVDRRWLPLVELTTCVVGSSMRAIVRIDGVDQPLRSSMVRSIRPLPGC